MTDRDVVRRRLDRLAWLLDESVRVPVIGRRIGIDSLIGLVPVAGDIVGGVLSLGILITAVRMGTTTPTLLRMIANVIIEVVVGAVPLLGDLFDMGFKANRRNVDLMTAHYDDPDGVARGSLIRVLGVALALLVLLLGLAWLAFRVALLAFGMLAGLFS